MQETTEHRKENAEGLRKRIALWHRLSGEARFLSHRDMMRLMERAIARARIPVKFSQGFNPRPRLSLPLPRPLGVASRDELLVLELAEEADPRQVQNRLAEQMPDGVELTRCERLEPGPMPRAVSAEYELSVRPDRAADLRRQLEELEGLDTWPWTRPMDRGPDKRLDLRQLVRAVAFDGERLTFRLNARGQAWARVEEVLGLLGLDTQLDRARLVRISVQWAGLETHRNP